MLAAKGVRYLEKGVYRDLVRWIEICQCVIYYWSHRVSMIELKYVHLLVT